MDLQSPRVGPTCANDLLDAACNEPALLAASAYGLRNWMGGMDVATNRRARYQNEIAQKTPTPVLQYLRDCHAEFAGEGSGALANYIPELTKANPAHFGIGLATIDGHVYEVGDTAVEFTIQSISKAFVFALALDLV